MERILLPFHLRADELNPNSAMEIGYVVKKNSLLSEIGKLYIEETKNYLDQYQIR